MRDKVDRGVDLANAGQFTEAISLYSAAIRMNPRVQLSYYNRGISYMGLHEYSRAVQDFDSVISLQTVNGGIVWKNPDFDDSDESSGQVAHQDVLYQRAIAKTEIDSFRSAFSDFEYLINSNYPEKVDCIIWQGIILGRMRHNSKACEYFEKAKKSAVSGKDMKAANEVLVKYCKSNNR